MKIKRIYHPYWDWEEVGYNMWGGVADKESYRSVAVDFTGNAKQYGEHMVRVTKEWKKSCEHNLTTLSSNRQAWIGHAACALAFCCPEDIVRSAWRDLTPEQKDAANAVADRAIELWEKNHLEGLCQKED